MQLRSAALTAPVLTACLGAPVWALLAGCAPPEPNVEVACYIDDDGDGFGATGAALVACTQGRPRQGGDCDDADRLVNPAQPEIACDGVDDDCDGMDGVLGDQDGDGFDACDDCDDLDPAAWPGAVEVACDGVDNDCDGLQHPDETDGDNDGFTRCNGDCDDGEWMVAPGRDERCNGVDDDCDTVFFPRELIDADGDGSPACGDCDDGDATRRPGLPELCDAVDNGCDGGLAADEQDADADGLMACAGDCDDGNPFVGPGMPEICDGVGNDCGPASTLDVDADGDGAPACADCDDGDPAASTYRELCDGLDSNCDGSIAGEEDLDGDGRLDCLMLRDSNPFLGNTPGFLLGGPALALLDGSTPCPEYAHWDDLNDVSEQRSGLFSFPWNTHQRIWTGGCADPSPSPATGGISLNETASYGGVSGWLQGAMETDAWSIAADLYVYDYFVAMYGSDYGDDWGHGVRGEIQILGAPEYPDGLDISIAMGRSAYYIIDTGVSMSDSDDYESVGSMLDLASGDVRTWSVERTWGSYQCEGFIEWNPDCANNGQWGCRSGPGAGVTRVLPADAAPNQTLIRTGTSCASAACGRWYVDGAFQGILCS